MENNQTTNTQPIPQNSAPHSELEKIKNEITTKLGGKSHKNLPFGNIAVTVMLGVLTLVSVAPMMASVNIFNKLKTGEVKASTGSSSAPQNNSVQNLPDMVGGC